MAISDTRVSIERRTYRTDTQVSIERRTYRTQNFGNVSRSVPNVPNT